MLSARNNSRNSTSPTENEIINRAFKVTRVNPHPKRKIIIIHGEINVSILGIGAMSYHDSIAEDTREFKKVIKLESLTETSDINDIVEDILAACPYVIEQQALELVIGAIEFVMSRRYDSNGLVISTNKYNNGYNNANDANDDDDDDECKSKSNFPNIFDDEDMATAESDADMKEISIDNLEIYIEMLYENLQEKTKGARYFSRLVTVPENLIIVFNHGSATNALFRTLLEDYRKSMDLTTNILRVCEQFAQFVDFHEHLLSHKLSSLIFEIIEYEMEIYAQWKQEISVRRAELESIIGPQEEQQQGSTSTAISSTENLASMSTKSLKAKIQLDRIQLRFNELTTKQDNLLLVAFKIQKYFYQSIPAEEFYKQDIISLIVNCLERKNTGLLTTVIDFLAILSTYQECKSQMLKSGIIEMLQKFLTLVNQPNNNVAANGKGSLLNRATANNEIMLGSLVVLLFNLSFDTKSRLRMMKFGVLQKIASIYENGSKLIKQKCILLLYNFSMDRKNRPKFATTNLVLKILKEIENTTESSPVNIYFIAITLNLATSKRCSQLIFKNGGLALLVQWAFKQENHLIMKIVRKLSEHDGAQNKNEFVHYVSDIAEAIGKTSRLEFIIECVGTLGNLNIPELDFKRLLLHCNLLMWIKVVLRKTLPVRASARRLGEPRTLEEVLFIEIAIFLSNCAEDEECSRFILQDELCNNLLAFCDNSVNIDVDIQIQLLYIFYKICRHKNLLQLIVEKQIPSHLFQLLKNDSLQMREVAEASLNLIGEYDDEWNMKVKQEKFTSYNRHWLDMVGKFDQELQLEDSTSRKTPQLKRPSSAMRRPPSAVAAAAAAGSNFNVSNGRRGLIPPQSDDSRENSARSKDSSSDTHKSSGATTPDDSDDNGPDDDEEEIDVEEDDEQLSKQKQQLKSHQFPHDVLIDSAETRNLFERLKHQFQQERDAKESNEYGIMSDPDNEDYFDDDENEELDSRQN